MMEFFIVLVLSNTAIDYCYQNFRSKGCGCEGQLSASTCAQLVIKACGTNITPCWCTKEDRLDAQTACV